MEVGRLIQRLHRAMRIISTQCISYSNSSRQDVLGHACEAGPHFFKRRAAQTERETCANRNGHVGVAGISNFHKEDEGRDGGDG